MSIAGDGSLDSVAAAANGDASAVGAMTIPVTVKQGKDTITTQARVAVAAFRSSGTAVGTATVSAASGLTSVSFASAAIDAGGSVFVAGSLFGDGTCDFGNGVTVEVRGVVDGYMISSDYGAAVLLKYSTR